MSNYPKAFAVGFGIVGLGYTLMLTTVPTEEQLYEARKHAAGRGSADSDRLHCYDRVNRVVQRVDLDNSVGPYN